MLCSLLRLSCHKIMHCYISVGKWGKNLLVFSRISVIMKPRNMAEADAADDDDTAYMYDKRRRDKKKKLRHVSATTMAPFRFILSIFIYYY